MKSHTVLLIEDEHALVEALARKLKQAGFNVLKATQGEEGLEMSLSHHPDLIVLDLLLPRMDGMTVLKKLRDDKWGSTAQVLVLTNFSDVKKMEETEKLGVREYMVKTEFKIGEVVTKIKEALA